ncbi:hypothetical protein FRB90_004024 [Tulasnella sp. 427]|nr:hypothetical protein FRB90_004024 [Tulasnella sp. 427]
MSSSFKRRTPATQPPPPRGTRLNVASSVLEISTGVPSLDDVLGGGQPLGSILIVLAPDRHSNWSELLQRYWIAQGLAGGQNVCVVGEPTRSAKLVEGCMWLSPAEYGESAKGAASEDEREPGAEEEVKIAWRYEGMKKFQTTVQTAGSRRDDYNHTFELTQKIPSEVVDSTVGSGQLRYLAVNPVSSASVLSEVSSQIKELVARQQENANQPVLRLAIPDFGGFTWGYTTPEASSLQLTRDDNLSELRNFFKDMIRFLYLLRGMRTMDLFTYTELHRHAEGGGENNLGFKCTRKRFIIETLHFDVEGGVSERRTAPPISASLHDHEHGDALVSSTVPITKAEMAKITLEAPPPARDEVIPPATTTKPKKARKVVAFQSGGRDLYDF